jgi:hypothetical protein
LKDTKAGLYTEVQANDLTKTQEKMMSTQPDMILQYARHLGQKYRDRGYENVEVKAEAYVTLNGKGSRLFIDSTVNLLNLRDDWKNKDWILPFEQKDSEMR